jgi:glycosyltransferase involved in cell wall biosynthesis
VGDEIARHGPRPRVLFAIGSLATGGSERQLVELVRRAHGRTIDASVVTFQQAAASPRNSALLAEAGVEHHALPRPPGNRLMRAILLGPKIGSLVRTLNPDLIYTWLEETALYFAPVARARRIPLVVARRNVSGSRLERYAIARSAIRLAERSAALVTVNSRAAAGEAVARGIHPERVRLVRNGHDPVDPLPMPDEATIRLGCVAQLRREKGHRRLLESLERVTAATPWHIELAGKGALLPDLEREAAARGLADRVDFLGEVEDVRSFWARQHIAVLLSDSEGSPNALIEAALAGRPIVATAAGGTPDVVAPAGGLLVGRDDVGAAAEAISTLIDDPALRRRFGEGAFEQAVSRFAVEDFVAGHVSAINEVLNGRR